MYRQDEIENRNSGALFGEYRAGVSPDVCPSSPLRVSDGGPMTLASPETLTRRSLDPVVGRAAKLQTNMKELQDTDPMPWGKYKGTPMQDVPADYLHYLWTNFGMKFKSGEVGDYILRNKAALKQEHPDGIWS